MHGQQNDKYTEMHGQQNDKYTEMHGQSNVKKPAKYFELLRGDFPSPDFPACC